ncbi:class I SAM-dependent methyltransferase [Comamonas composti]|uniref:class I SAM-dependent methyltransferase n=1 Tax=Comamonas composti TaxID=408558 RepID=UPI0006880C90|nr:class I SAM-dependent methyltransferase [Comamonas composti]
MQALFNAIASMDLPMDAQRLFHGRGGLYPGCEHLSLDAYPPVLVLTSFAPLAEHDLLEIGEALEKRWHQIAPGQVLNWVFQTRIAGASDTRLMQGCVPEPHVVKECGSRYLVHVLRGKNHGLFLDMARGRQWVAEHVANRAMQPGGLKVLNLFSYTCAFSVVALRAGASQVLNMDMAQGALSIGRQNHDLNNVKKGASFLAHDIFSSWGKITRGGPYGLIVVDPPSYQKGSFIATKDYARLLRRLPALLAPGGHVLLCLNAPELGPDFLQEQVGEYAPDLEFVQRLDNPPAFADVDETRSLKALVYRLKTLWHNTALADTEVAPVF